MDIVGLIHSRASDGCKYILILVVSSTKWPEAVPLKNIDAVTTAEAMVEISCRISTPRRVMSDRGIQLLYNDGGIAQVIVNYGTKNNPILSNALWSL